MRMRLSLYRHCLGFFCLGVWLSHPVLVWAQDIPGDKPPEPKSWVLAYILVVLMLGLAIALICRSGNRRKEVRGEQPAA